MNPTAMRFFAVLGLFAGYGAAQCSGCRDFLVTYSQDTGYAGNQPIPGVGTSFTPGLGTGPGTCVPAGAGCAETPCKFNGGIVRVENLGGTPVDVNNPNGTNRGTLDVGDSSGFRVSPPAVVNIDCGWNHPLLQVVLSNGDIYVIALRCTACPGANPY